jgi:hypothetical protein
MHGRHEWSPFVTNGKGSSQIEVTAQQHALLAAMGTLSFIEDAYTFVTNRHHPSRMRASRHGYKLTTPRTWVTVDSAPGRFGGIGKVGACILEVAGSSPHIIFCAWRVQSLAKSFGLTKEEAKEQKDVAWVRTGDLHCMNTHLNQVNQATGRHSILRNTTKPKDTQHQKGRWGGALKK